MYVPTYVPAPCVPCVVNKRLFKVGDYISLLRSIKKYLPQEGRLLLCTYSMTASKNTSKDTCPILEFLVLSFVPTFMVIFIF